MPTSTSEPTMRSASASCATSKSSCRKTSNGGSKKRSNQFCFPPKVRKAAKNYAQKYPTHIRDDVEQEYLIGFYRAYKKAHDHTELETMSYCHQRARFTVTDFIRNLMHTRRLDQVRFFRLDPPLDAGEDPFAPVTEDVLADDPADAVSRSEVMTLLYDAIAALPTRQRCIIYSRFFHHKTQATVGASIGLSNCTVSIEERRALECLKASLMKYYHHFREISQILEA